MHTVHLTQFYQMLDTNSLSLDIETYTLQDILKLFSLSNTPVSKITNDNMKSARRIVMMMHPDKSGLDKEYFQFFAKAYERLSDVVDYANRSNQCASSYMEKQRKMNVELENDNGFGASLVKAKVVSKYHTVGENWSKWKREFDAWFEKHGELSADSEANSGYDEFMKSTKDLLPEGATKEQAMRFMEQRKSTLGALVAKESITGIDSFNCGTSGGEDLRRAYTETVVPVTEDDFNSRPKYNSLDEYKRARHHATEALDYETSNRDYAIQKEYQEQRELAQYYDQLSLMDRGKEDLNKFRSRIQRLTN